MRYILNSDYSKRIVWYDEGMAQFMSGEKDLLNDIDAFKDSPLWRRYYSANV